MKKSTHFGLLAIFLSTLFGLNACSSSGGSSSGLGVVIAGFWQGTLQVTDGSQANFTMNLSQSADDEDSLFTSFTLTGVISMTGHPCFSGGSVETGILGGTSFNINIKHGVGGGDTLVMAGSTSSRVMRGSWTNQPTTTGATTTTTTDADGETTTETTADEPLNCNISGTFLARR